MTSASLAPVAGDRGVLRMLGEADLPLTLAWRNHPDSREWFHSSAVIAPEQHEAWYRGYLERDDDYVFVMEADGRPVAQAALYDIGSGSAEFGRLLVDPAARGAGHSHRVIALVLRVADEVMGLDELRLEVKTANARAIGAYERAGFSTVDEPASHADSLLMRRGRP
ncbi:MAG: GNAT family N-acetyltransferase [Microbacteriaceae bacterium]|nr:GNAT family N-acetyltransferase [Microbacteriaceae bacterium]